MPTNYRRTNVTSSWTTAAKIVGGYQEAYDIDNNGIEISSIGMFSDLDALVDRVLSDPITYNNRSQYNIILIDDEFMTYDTILKLPNGNYFLNGIIRGIYDTIPANHANGSPLYFLDFMMPVENKPMCPLGTTSTESLGVSASTRKQDQDFDELTAITYTTRQRGQAPSIMANLTWNCDRGTETVFNYHNNLYAIGGDLVFNFLQRDKFKTQRAIISQKEDTLNGQKINASYTTQSSIKLVQEEGLTSEMRQQLYQGVETIYYRWTNFCKDVGAYLRVINQIKINVATYDTKLGIYSYSTYVKDATYRIPEIAGICTNVNDVITYGNSIVDVFDLDNVYVPQTPYNIRTAIPYVHCPIIAIGEPDSSGVLGQDGVTYRLTGEAYRVDGFDKNTGGVLGHRMDIDDGFVYAISFNDAINNTTSYYTHSGGQEVPFTPFGT